MRRASRDRWSSGRCCSPRSRSSQLAGPPLEGWFTALTPPPDGLEWFVPASIVYDHVHGLLGIFGILYVAVGLSQTRHWAYRPSGRTAGYVVAAVGVVAALATIYWRSRRRISAASR